MSEENIAASEKELSDAVDEVLSEATVVVDEVATLTADLQRLQAEYANYRKRLGENLKEGEGLIALNLAIPFLIPGIDWKAHLGGLIGGGLATLVVKPKKSSWE